MKKFMMAVTQEVYDALLFETKRLGLRSVQETTRLIIGDWYAKNRRDR